MSFLNIKQDPRIVERDRKIPSKLEDLRIDDLRKLTIDLGIDLPPNTVEKADLLKFFENIGIQKDTNIRDISSKISKLCKIISEKTKTISKELEIEEKEIEQPLFIKGWESSLAMFQIFKMAFSNYTLFQARQEDFPMIRNNLSKLMTNVRFQNYVSNVKSKIIELLIELQRAFNTQQRYLINHFTLLGFFTGVSQGFESLKETLKSYNLLMDYTIQDDISNSTLEALAVQFFDNFIFTCELFEGALQRIKAVKAEEIIKFKDLRYVSNSIFPKYNFEHKGFFKELDTDERCRLRSEWTFESLVEFYIFTCITIIFSRFSYYISKIFFFNLQSLFQAYNADIFKIFEKLLKNYEVYFKDASEEDLKFRKLYENDKFEELDISKLNFINRQRYQISILYISGKSDKSNIIEKYSEYNDENMNYTYGITMAYKFASCASTVLIKNQGKVPVSSSFLKHMNLSNYGFLNLNHMPIAGLVMHRIEKMMGYSQSLTIYEYKLKQLLNIIRKFTEDKNINFSPMINRIKERIILIFEYGTEISALTDKFSQKTNNQILYTCSSDKRCEQFAYHDITQKENLDIYATRDICLKNCI